MSRAGRKDSRPGTCSTPTRRASCSKKSTLGSAAKSGCAPAIALRNSSSRKFRFPAGSISFSSAGLTEDDLGELQELYATLERTIGDRSARFREGHHRRARAMSVSAYRR